MKNIGFTLLALFLLSTLASPTARAQGVYNRAKAAARRVAPSPQPVAPSRGAPYQAPAPALVPRSAPIPPGNYAPAAPTPRVAGPRPTVASKDLPDDVVRRTVEFQKKRAEDGSPTAQYDLGIRYLKGDGVEQDEATGVKWLKAASKNGSYIAAKKLKELEDSKKEELAVIKLTQPKKVSTPPAKDSKKPAPTPVETAK